MHYYSPGRGMFFHADVHGPRTITQLQPPSGRARKSAPAPEPVEVEVPNPDTRIPADAVEVTPDEHRALFEAQAAGKRIVAGPDGRPIAVAMALTPEQLWKAIRKRRDALLARSDWSQLPDVPPALQGAWRPYRQALRDLPGDTKDPASPPWPEAPAP